MKAILMVLFFLLIQKESFSQQQRQAPPQTRQANPQRQTNQAKPQTRQGNPQAQQRRQRQTNPQTRQANPQGQQRQLTPQQRRRRAAAAAQRRQQQQQNQASTNNTPPTINAPYLELLDSNFHQWVVFLDFPTSNRLDYNGVYYNPSNNTYVHATITEVPSTNYIDILTQMNILAKREKTYVSTFQENGFYYLGDVDQTNRVFAYSTNTNRFYIKQLTPIVDSIYKDNGKNVFSNTQSVYPVVNTLHQVQYTNNTGIIFNRILSEQSTLRLLGEVVPGRLMTTKP